ncbi:YqcC family protein [Alteromonas sp. ASW11-19]|uniref:YqcC family protein n=2 Tax=Alteromonas salexigens TaxID=2982530 RepID=A0ABT2VNR0_9ALTE|nr:YqcC family protein [Alteromonas salexigens]
MQLLNTLEQQLRHAGLWSQHAPVQGVDSHVPFAADIMPFQQWLQFVLLPRLRELCEQDKPLPSMAVAPAAEMYLPDETAIIDTLTQLDRLAAGTEHD